MSQGVKLTPGSVRRIARVCARVEGMPGAVLSPASMGPAMRRSGGGGGGFWAELTGTYNATTGYPWKRLQAKSDGTGLEDCDPAITGTHLFEADGDETKVSGDRVWVRPLATVSGTPTYVFVVGGPAPNGVLVKITSNATGNGMYNGKSATAVTSAAGAVPTPTWAAENDCLIWNTLSDVHDLAADTILFGVHVGMTTDTTPLKIVAVFAFKYNC